MRFRSPLHGWPVLVVALLAGCEDDKMPSGSGGTGGAGGSGGTAVQDSGADTGTTGGGGTGGAAGTGGGGTGGVTPPPDGGLAPCLEQPTDLDRPPAGRLPCELLPPGFVAP